LGLPGYPVTIPFDDPTILVAACLVLGLVIGSFLNVVIHRLPKMMEREWHGQCAQLRGEETSPQPTYNLIVPRSACPTCGHQLTALENIPVLSYLFLRGRCSNCGKRISPRYPLVESLSGLLSGMAAWHFGWGLALLFALLLLWMLIALAFIDLDTQLLPDSLTQPLVWLGLFANLQGVFTTLSSAVIGAMAGYVFLWAIYWLFKLATGKEGMGFGDFKLFAALGAWLGWEMLPLIILLAAASGAVIGLLLIWLSRPGPQGGKPDQAHEPGLSTHFEAKAASPGPNSTDDVAVGAWPPIPFGPYLALSGVIALFYGQAIVAAYLQGFMP
jgi:leader peptidase (prepilin peptidase) / N-methyltransferase